MEKRKEDIDEKEDLARAKRDLLMRFIKDQESLQTGHIDGKMPSNNDATFDILDGLPVSKEFSHYTDNMSRNTHYTGNKTNEVENDNSKPNKNETDSRREQSYRIMSSKTRKSNECKRSEIREHGKFHPSDGNARPKEEGIRLKSAFKLDSIVHPIEKSRSARHLRRLRSAPSISALEADSRSFLRHGEINVLKGRELKARKISSLSIVVPREQDLIRKQSVTCAQITRPLDRVSLGISSVDVQLLDRRNVSSLTGPYVPVFHLPPIAPAETTGTPPSTT